MTVTDWLLPLTAILVVIVVSLLFSKSSRRCDIPGPRGLPYLGLTPFLPKEPYIYLAQLSRKFGDIYCCRLGSTDVIILNTYAAIEEFFKKNGKVFSNRIIDIPDSLDIPVGFADLHYGEKHVELRTFTTRNLNKQNHGEAGTLEGIINDEVSQFCTYIERSYMDEPVNADKLFPNCTVNLLVQLVLGRRLEYDSQELKKLYHDVLGMATTPNIFAYFRNPAEKKLIQMLDIFPNDIMKRIGEGTKQVFVKSHVEVERFLCQAKEGTASVNCFLGRFLSTMERKKAESAQTFMSENAMKGVLTNIFVGGIEATAVICSWIVVLLTKYQDVQTKLREEIFVKIGRDGVATLANEAGMDYTNAFLQEVQRFGSLGPLGAPHTAAEDTHHGGYFIPKGTYILSNLFAANHNEDIFPDPDEFKPERFIDGHGKFIRDKHVIMFGLGYRSCPGQIFTLRQTFLMLVQLLQKFRLVPPEGVVQETISQQGIYHNNARVPPDVKVRFLPIE